MFRRKFNVARQQGTTMAKECSKHIRDTAELGYLLVGEAMQQYFTPRKRILS